MLKNPPRLKDIFIVFNGPQVCMTETLMFLTLKLVNLLISIMRARAIIEFSNLSDFKVPQLYCGEYDVYICAMKN